MEVNSYTLYPDKLPDSFDGFTIVQISDTHIRSLNDMNKDLIGMAEKKAAEMGSQVDCVCITGDLIDNNMSILEEVIGYVGKIAQKYPVYFVGGNHDYKPGIWEFEKALSKVGVTVLENKATKISRSNGHIWMVGVSLAQFKMNDEDKAFKDVPIKDFSVTMIHDPDIFENLAAKGADFILAGHTHAGQIRLPFLPVLYSPGEGFFPKYGYGFFTTGRPDYGNAVMYISKGIGYTGDRIGMRFTNRPEIAVFELKTGGN